jgi:hypothetical protein
MSEPCSWGIVVDDCPAYDSLTTEQQQMVVDMATDYLWNWTDRMFGICEVSVRPCRGNCAGANRLFGSTWSSGKLLPTLIGGSWYNLGCGTCGTDDCSCPAMSSLKLPGPVSSIVEVRQDGLLVPATSYRVDNGYYLVRLDGWAWPTCQNMTMDPATDPETFEVTYLRGVEVPAGGKAAATKLACEFAKSIATPSKCALPERIKTITRDGVAVTLMDDFKDLESYKTGIWLIDSWVSSVMKPVRASSVRSVDIPHPRFRTRHNGSPDYYGGY